MQKNVELPKDAVVFRTFLTKEVHEEFTSFAQSFATGRGHWDYGVAIQFLLEHWKAYRNTPSVQELSAKLDFLIEQGTVEEVEEPKTELLRGEKV